MELISVRELTGLSKWLDNAAGETLVKGLFRLLGFNRVNDCYARHSGKDAVAFCEGVLADAGISVVVAAEDLENIPAEGSFITVSNHAYGGIDGLILLKMLTSVRSDYKVLVNFMLNRIKPLNSHFFGVNPFESHKEARSSHSGLKDAIYHIHQGHPLGIFPAGEVSSYRPCKRAVTDREWQPSILKFIRKEKVPVIPVWFEGHNGILFNLLGFIHPMLRTVKLPSELFNKQGKEIRVRIGSPVPVKEMNEFRDTSELGRFLRTKTYSLGLSMKPEKKRNTSACVATVPVREPVPAHAVQAEVEALPPEYQLFSIQGNMVFCAPSSAIPRTMEEIGRQRELTYRDIGEGTNKATDTDRYDAYFEQLFIWDTVAKCIVGGYRVGKGKPILEQYGIGGFYIHSLFRIDRAFEPVLKISIELGRSFITKAYQRRPLSLFLLWKGILYLLLKHPEYRYLIGPVSISNAFRDVSKTLCVEYLKDNYFNREFASMIHARNPFRGVCEPVIDLAVFLKHTEPETARLDRFVQDFDPAYKTPVLLKKYTSVNAEALGFNVDPLFNYCLDALMILDIYEVPFETFESLSKEINDQSILDRFRQDGKPDQASFLRSTWSKNALR